MEPNAVPSLRLPQRDIPIPASVSLEAQACLVPRDAGGGAFPALDDKAGWHAYIASQDEALLPLIEAMNPTDASFERFSTAEGVAVWHVTPQSGGHGDGVILDFHGGGLHLCGGEIGLRMAMGLASKVNRHVRSVDYRMPPDFPYPAALDDAVSAYRAVLAEYPAQKVVVYGASAGGNLAAAAVLRARDEGLQMPGGVVLETPEVDLTESGDSFQTNLGIDPNLISLMQPNLLYADGHDLSDPYLSPLFGDFSAGFPPTLLTTGTRDLFLSNTVRMHRALRKAGIRAELHVTEAGGHGGFPLAPEGREILNEIVQFIDGILTD